MKSKFAKRERKEAEVVEMKKRIDQLVQDKQNMKNKLINYEDELSFLEVEGEKYKTRSL